MSIPIVDLFAGPGGLGEGFSSLIDSGGERVFKIAISIEKEFHAHETLELRAFTRSFDPGKMPVEYYRYLRGEITKIELFAAHPTQAKHAAAEAWLAELGSDSTPNSLVDERISTALGKKTKPWLLIGGPPCQAYSLVGRSRMMGVDPKKYASDHRHFLYKEYLRILAIHRPPVFVMENVKGLLSASVKNEKILPLILEDLAEPAKAMCDGIPLTISQNLEYTLHTLRPYEENSKKGAASDFVVNCEQHGIPQARHRLIIVGVRSDIHKAPSALIPTTVKNIEDVLGDLPRLRSGISKESDSGKNWALAISDIGKSGWSKFGVRDESLLAALVRQSQRIRQNLKRGGRFVPGTPAPAAHADWFVDDQLKGFCNHESRGHMRSDLHRYFFFATFAKMSGKSPVMKDFPTGLLPNHGNIAEAIDGKKFSDRFRVQCNGRPSTTVVAHIAKDGHYFIHYDPRQCRSLTVREAARLQTFPDNYFFEGPRTDQYRQVGNAVPPLIARQIAEIIAKLF